MDSPSRDRNSQSTSTSAVPNGSLKRSASALLPAFEPLSSSPSLPRPLKRQATSSNALSSFKYPTPVPTSSTGILSSSPPARASALFTTNSRQTPTRTLSAPSASLAPSTVPESRAPLSTVPTIDLSDNGEPVLMGRSSNSSHHQLSANKLISRVHVRAKYIPASAPLGPSRVEIVCSGWNGLKLHCQGRTWELHRGDTFTSETEGTDIMIDVQDARVMVRWPRRQHVPDGLASLSDSLWEDSPRPASRSGGSGLIQSSPLRRATRISSPISPTPAKMGNLSSSQRLQALLPTQDDDPVQIYEDASENQADEETELPALREALDPNAASMVTELNESFSSDLSDAEDKDPDEENDPVVHSFGPFGANISNRLASITASSPRANGSPKRRCLQSSSRDTVTRVAAKATLLNTSSPSDHPRSPSPLSPPVNAAAITNHAVNQLAFSRLSSTPLSTILANLPVEERQSAALTKERLREIIEASPCVGCIPRQGKDAAGKPLESEYYYVPEEDKDDQRRAAVVDGLRKPSLRNCRKQHKQYYWKRPKTP